MDSWAAKEGWHGVKARTDDPGQRGLFDQVHIVTLDQPDVALPLVTEPVPGFYHVVIIAGEIIGPIQHERGGDTFTSARRRAAGGFQTLATSMILTISQGRF
jgi:hypothetical protein